MVKAIPRPLYPRDRPGTHCIGGWVGPRAGLDRCGKSRFHRNTFPGPTSPYQVAVNEWVPGAFVVEVKQSLDLQLEPLQWHNTWVSMTSTMYQTAYPADRTASFPSLHYPVINCSKCGKQRREEFRSAVLPRGPDYQTDTFELRSRNHGSDFACSTCKQSRHFFFVHTKLY